MAMYDFEASVMGPCLVGGYWYLLKRIIKREGKDNAEQLRYN